jgi:hypothetical protein
MRQAKKQLRRLVLAAIVCSAVGCSRADNSFDDLPYGCFVNKRTVASRDETTAIGQKLGASLERLSNTDLTVQGAPIKVNLIDAKTDADAAKVFAAISAMHPDPAFCVRLGKRVVEYVGNDPALAIKASYELGFVSKPKRVRYRITAQIATIDKADYMSLTSLFNLLLAAGDNNPGREAVSEITSLSKRFHFGHSLVMRSADVGRSKARYNLTPAPTAHRRIEGDITTYRFGNLPKKLGIPCVTAAMQISTDESGSAPTTRKADRTLLCATESWPSDDPEIVAVAKEITTGRRTAEDKVQAILEWLAPGKNINFGGPVLGSRWGMKRVMKQRFGQCWDFSDCFITLCRASGVPCRQVGGWLFGTSGHIWAEYLDEGKSWRQVDATGGGKLPCGIYHIPYFTSENGEMPILYVSMPRIEIIATQ